MAQAWQHHLQDARMQHGEVENAWPVSTVGCDRPIQCLGEQFRTEPSTPAGFVIFGIQCAEMTIQDGNDRTTQRLVNVDREPVARGGKRRCPGCRFHEAGVRSVPAFDDIPHAVQGRTMSLKQAIRVVKQRPRAAVQMHVRDAGYAKFLGRAGQRLNGWPAFTLHGERMQCAGEGIQAAIDHQAPQPGLAHGGRAGKA